MDDCGWRRSSALRGGGRVFLLQKVLIAWSGGTIIHLFGNPARHEAQEIVLAFEAAGPGWRGMSPV